MQKYIKKLIYNFIVQENVNKIQENIKMLPKKMREVTKIHL